MGRDWLARSSADSQSPAASYVGVSGLIALAPSLALGAELSSSINPYGCDSDLRCYEYRLTRLGLVAESSLALLEAPEQGLEAWLELGAHATKTSLRSNAQSGSRDTTWGVGVTLRGGPRVRMRRLTLGPYAEGLIMNVGARFGAGFGVQIGLRF